MSSKLVSVLNCSSSPLKFAIINIVDGEEYFSGLAECFYPPEARAKWRVDGSKQGAALDASAAHNEALSFTVNITLAQKPELSTRLTAVGRCIIHSDEEYTSSVVIGESIIQGIRGTTSFALLHNPAHLIGIKEAPKSFLQLKGKNVAIFDTAFYQAIPEESYLYALPYNPYRKHGIHRYGAHDTSHFYVTQEATRMLNRPAEELSIIIYHPDNGGSVSATRNGKYVDTSMGLTPLEGPVMGTRSGDIDPTIIFHLHDTLGMSVDAASKSLTRESGLLDLTEMTSDCRYVEGGYATKEDTKRVMDAYCHRLVGCIGAHTVLMDGRLDAVVFTGGIGENATMVRELSLGELDVLGFEVDHEHNLAARFGKSGFINKEGTRPVVVIPANEELIIVQDTSRLTT